MTSRKNVQNTHISANLRALHTAMLEVVSFMNRPQNDDALLKEAAIPLDRALFPLLVMVDRFGPIGVVELADRAGRDYTTVSRQLAKLESLGLAERQANESDRRIREAVVTSTGKAMIDALDAARERMGLAIFESWEPSELDDLVRLMSKLANALHGRSE